MAGVEHVDKVDHDQAANIAQTQLTSNFFCRFFVGVKSCLFNIAAFGSAC